MRAVPRAGAAVLTVLLHLPILFALVRVTASTGKPPQPAAENEMAADKLHGAGEQIIRVDIRPSVSTHGRACERRSSLGSILQCKAT